MITNYTVNFWAVFDLRSNWTTSSSELLLCIGNIFDGYFNPYNKVRELMDLNIATELTNS
jgi:hypothetical protein